MKNLFDKQYKNLKTQYEQAVYACPEMEWRLKIGEGAAEVDRFMCENTIVEFCVLTAWNPQSRLLSEEENIELYKGLEKYILDRGYSFLSGLNVDPSNAVWDEPTFWIFGMDVKEGRQVATGWNQNAFLYYSFGGIARLIWCIG